MAATATSTATSTATRTAHRRFHVHARAAHSSGSVYRPRRPTATPLYPVVQHNLETFLAAAEEADPLGFGVSAWIERDFRAYLRCGILAHGFARARCDDCGHERLIAFSCKGRGVCPSCNARRMAEVAAHMTDHVLPHLPVRQWVLSLPKRLRPFLHYNPEVAGSVLSVFLRALRSTLRHVSPTAPPGATFAAVSFPQRFGSSLNAHFHFHVLALDGVLSEQGPGGQVRFHEATLLTPERWKGLERTVQHRVLRAFRGRGLLEQDVVSDMLTWQASGGFSVDASVRVEGDDRAGVERLVRYCARGPLALERLHALGGQHASPDARLLYRLPEPDLQGRTVLLLSPLELLERLARQRFALLTDPATPHPPPPLPRPARAPRPAQARRRRHRQG
ncbi:MAG: transposase, partial [Thermoleophilia bacterium]|nr:transposase [Thermoleophilia bacterium]